MAKLVFLLIGLVTLELCLARRGRPHHRRHHDDPRRRWRHRSISDWDWDWDDSSEDRGWGSHWMDRFNRRRYAFGLGPRHDPWFDFDFSWGGGSKKSWWEGPNVCFSRTEDTEKADSEKEIAVHVRYQTQVCDGSDTVHKCTTTYVTPEGKETVTETYECCPGFARTPGAFGCDQEFELHDIIQTLENLELTEMVKAMDSVGLNEDYFLEAETNFTIFVPTNEAFQKYLGIASVAPGITLQDMNSVMIVSEPIRDTLVNSTRSLLLGHMVVERLPSSQLSDDLLIETASPYKSKIRINTYKQPASITTANCHTITKPDVVANNGIVHVVDSVLTPVVETLMDIVSKNPELSTFKTVIGTSTLGASLRDDGSFTLLAPTNAAFSRMDQGLLRKILSDQKCLDKILKNHILPNVVCSAVVQGDAKTRNMLKRFTNLTRDSDDKLYADGAQIVTADLMATNGVLYIIDDVLLTDEALDVLTLAQKQGYDDFLTLVEKAELKKELETAENLTVFVPTNEAIQAMDPKILADKTKLQQVLKYHVVPDMRTCSGMYNDLELDTLAGEQLRINEYSSFPFGRQWTQTAQCAQILKTDLKGCKSVIHVVDKVLIPPVGNVVDVLARDSRFTTLVQLIKEADLGDELQEEGPFTVFAPTNEAFNSLRSSTVRELRKDKELLKETLLHHVSKDFVCCAEIVKTGWFRTQKIRMLSGEVYNIGRDRQDDVNIGDAEVETCDITATNGVVHVIDEVLMKNRPSRWSFDWY